MGLIVGTILALALALLAYLVYLVLFERGASYHASEPVHGLDDGERLRLLSAVLATPPQPIHSVQILQEGPDLYAALLEAIRSARTSVHLEAYIFHRGRAADSMLEALCQAARSGVRVRVIIDAVGSLMMPRSQYAALNAAGGEVQLYHPLRWPLFRRWNSRTHRNLLVVDGEIAFIGGAGIADHWSRSEPRPWRDCIVRVTGPIVGGLQAVFAENWLECSGRLLVGESVFPRPRPGPQAHCAEGLAVGSTPTAGLSTRARILVQFLLASARESIDLCSPYFIPDLGIRRELLAARQRGVRVRVLTGGVHSDHGIVRRAGRRRYGPLLQAGVELREYAAHMLHTKLLIVDGSWSLVGSTNIDHRSFGLNDEVNLLIRSADVAAELRAMFELDLGRSHALDYEGWLRRSWGERLLATLGRLIERHQ